MKRIYTKPNADMIVINSVDAVNLGTSVTTINASELQKISKNAINYNS